MNSYEILGKLGEGNISLFYFFSISFCFYLGKTLPVYIDVAHSNLYQIVY